MWVVDRDSTVHYRRVEVGEVTAENCRVILSGLIVGEKVVADGSQRLSNGQRVRLL